MRSLGRLLNPASIAVFGGSWAANVITQLQKSGYAGALWPVHPSKQEILGVPCYADIASLPGAPDAAFIGVNRELTIELVRGLSAVGAGGAVCFASGFRETDADKESDPESGRGTDLQQQLIDAAGAMPMLGPNCYGFINYLENIAMWPDQHGGKQVERGVGIIAQSSNIAINMTMQQRGLSLAYMITAGNQAQTGISELARELIADARVSSIGLYIEGFGDIRAFEKMATEARAAGKAIVALKIGKSQKAQAATMTHTASMAGGAAASSAFLARLGIVEVDSVAVFLETLKLLDAIGPLAGSKLCSVSCSGGEASLMADLASNTAIEFPDLGDAQVAELASILGSKVTLANPLDYHTYIWGDVPVMTACFKAVMAGGFDLVVFVLDIPRDDICDPAGHDCAIEAIIAARQQTGANVAVLGMLSENLNEAVTARFQAAGVVPLHGMETGLSAIDAAIRAGLLVKSKIAEPVLLSTKRDSDSQSRVLSEYQAKSALQEFGLTVPGSWHVDTKDAIAGVAYEHNFPLVLKGQGLAHKTEAGAVILNIDSTQAMSAAIDAIPECPDGYLVEEMVSGIIAELIIGVTRDELGLYLLTLGAGGVLAEIMTDTVSLLLPAGRDEIRAAIGKLKINKILQGYRGKPAVDIQAVLDAVEAVSRYVEANLEKFEELDINPLAVGRQTAIAVDALIRLRD